MLSCRMVHGGWARGSDSVRYARNARPLTPRESQMSTYISVHEHACRHAYSSTPYWLLWQHLLVMSNDTQKFRTGRSKNAVCTVRHAVQARGSTALCLESRLFVGGRGKIALFGHAQLVEIARDASRAFGRVLRVQRENDHLECLSQSFRRACCRVGRERVLAARNLDQGVAKLMEV